MPAIHRWYTKAAIRFARDAREWGILPRRAWAIALLPLGVALAAAATVLHPPLFIWLLDEDSLIEWLQFLALLAAGIFLPLVAFALLKTGHKAMALLYGVVAAGVWFLAGEEISWGQRIFGWQTPEAMEAINRQGETTVHNIGGVQELVPAAMLLASLYGACAPLIWNAARARWKHLGSAHLLVPPLCLVPAFGLAAAYRLFRLLVWPSPDYGISEYGEVMEFSLYLGLALFCWLNLRRLLVTRPAARSPRHRLTATA
ncbi:hypothetical protein QF031_000871 [Pseudarthrobacter defluvii]|uniref:hypothetical protein n=1 Tax=Pseudarthrobacter defluvii TaxID=410837 RepID=UPI00277E317D|nr:hypothetical protein [Pseudarthrobacter defluvii]MDQ0768122.1 hypothetical protein [Pseudarthrobacter defluvii]